MSEEEKGFRLLSQHGYSSNGNANDPKWESLHLLATADGDDRLTDHEKQQLTALLRFYSDQYVTLDPAAKSVAASEWNENQLHDEKVKWCPLLWIVLLICLSSFTFGYTTIQTTLVLNKGHNYRYSLNNTIKTIDSRKFEQSLISSATLIGASIGALLIFIYSACFSITYTFSRKRILILSNIPIFFGGIIALLAIIFHYGWIVITGFILQGIGVGISSIIAPILIAEISPVSVRAFLTLFSQLFITFGMLVSALVCWLLLDIKHGWMYIVVIGIIAPVLQLFLQKYITQSPRLLIADFYKDKTAHYVRDKKGFYPLALNIIAQFYVDEMDAVRVYNGIKMNLWYNRTTCIDENERNREVSFTRSICVGIFMNALQQLTGCNVIFYNSQSIIDPAIHEKHFIVLGLIIIYGANFVATFFCVVCVRFNFVQHKTLLFVGTSMMLTSVLFLAIINLYTDDQKLIDNLSMSKLPFYVVGYAISLAGFTWLLNTELYPMCHRIKYGSLCVAVQWVCNMCISLIACNKWYGLVWAENDNRRIVIMYFICGGMIVITIMFIASYVKETKGQTLEYAVRKHNPGVWVN